MTSPRDPSHQHEEQQLRSSALQNAKSILVARQRAERDLINAREALQQKTDELAHSLAMMRATLESTTDGILVTNEHRRVTGFNEKFAQMWRLSPEVMESGLHDLVLDASAVQMTEPAAYLDRVREIYLSWPNETADVLNLEDGRVFERHSRIQRVANRNVGRVWSFRDVTARHHAERELRQQREAFRVTLASIGDAVITTDTESRVTFLNPVAETMTGWKSLEATGEPLERVFDIVHEHTKAPSVSPIQRALAEGKTVALANHTALIARDGTETAIEDSAAPIRDANGAIFGAVMVFHDVTERRRAEEALRHSHAQFSAIINRSPIGIFLVDSDFRLRHINAKAIPIFSSVAHPIGQDLALVLEQIWPAAPVAETVAAFTHTLRSGEPFVARSYSAKRRERETPEYFDWELHRLTLPDGRNGVVCYFIDVSPHVAAQQALRESAQRLQLALSSSDLGDWSWDAATDEVWLGVRAKEIFGLPLTGSITWAQMRDRLHETDRERARLAVHHAITEHTDYDIEYRVQHAPGDFRWISARGRGVYAKDGAVLSMVGIVQDISARKAAAEEMRRSEVRFRELADAMPQIVWTARTSGELDYYNQRWYDYTGAADGKAGVTSLTDALHADDRARCQDVWRESVATGRPYQIDYRFRNRDGEYRWHLGRALPVRNEEGEIIRWYGSSTDIHEQKLNAVALREEYTITEQLNAVAKALATELDLERVVQIIIDAGTRIMRAQFGVFSYQLQDEPATPRFALSGEPRKSLSEFPRLRTAGPFGLEVQGEPVIRLNDVRNDPRFDPPSAASPDTAVLFPVVSYLAVPVLDRSGQVIGGLFFGHTAGDVFTERDEKIIIGVAAQAAAAMNTARLYQAEQQARTAAEQANHAKDQFLATLSHELRTPLTPVLAILSSLGEESSVPAAFARDLELMRRNVELEARLIDDLLDLTRISQGKLELHCERVALSGLIENAIQTCLPELSAKHLSLIRHQSEPDQIIVADGARITQILWNLLKNAIKFTPEHGSVVVSARSLPAHLCVEIRDTGRGIEPEALGRVFDAFEQGDRKTTQQFGGLGLGLAISKAIAEAHHGTITAASEGTNRGSTFTLNLPLTVTDEMKSNESLPFGLAGPKHPPVQHPAKTIPTARILLVEDHVDTATVLTRMLKRTGYDVFHAETVTGALKLAAQEIKGGGIDLVVSDLSLPDGSGLDLMKALSQQYGLRGIALSGFGMESDIEQSAAAGFSRHLIKPINIAVIRSTIAELLQVKP